MWAGRARFDSRQEKYRPQRAQTNFGVQPEPHLMGIGGSFFVLGQNVRCVKLSIHLLLVPRQRMAEEYKYSAVCTCSVEIN
jgi:hypothetical protein